MILSLLLGCLFVCCLAGGGGEVMSISFEDQKNLFLCPLRGSGRMQRMECRSPWQSDHLATQTGELVGLRFC